MTPDEKRAKRIHDITYSTADRAELAERMVELEELVRDMMRCITYNHDCRDCVINGERCDASILDSRMQDLGLELP